MNGPATILTIQGLFYIATGLWPVVHLKSFETVSGPKQDKGLVRTVGLMITVSGIFFIKYRETECALFLPVADALVLAGIDVYYVWKRVIWKVYLWDAVVEVIFIGLILVTK